MGTVNISGKTYNIYGTHITDDAGPPVVPSASTYFGASLNASAWNDASLTQQAQALVTATRILDKQTWVGAVTDSATPQPLAWPRTGATNCRTGVAVPDDEVPEGIVFGSYELALAILADATVQTSSSSGSNVRRTRSKDKVGDLETERETEYFTSTNIPGSNTNAGRFPPAVQEFVACYFGGSGIATVTITGSQASFFYGRDYSYDGEGLP